MKFVTYLRNQKHLTLKNLDQMGHLKGLFQKEKGNRSVGKKERHQKILMKNAQYAKNNLWREKFGDFVTIVPFGITEIVYIYKMNRSG